MTARARVRTGREESRRLPVPASALGRDRKEADAARLARSKHALRLICAKAIQAAIAAGRSADACAQLVAFKHEVSAQTGKKISEPTAAALQREAGRVSAAIGCE